MNMLYVSLSINSIFQVIFFVEFFFIKIYVTTHIVTRILRIKNKENGKKKWMNFFYVKYLDF